MPAAVADRVKPYKDDQEDSEEVFSSKEEMEKSLIRLCYGDLYLLGKIWISVVRTILVGAKLCLIPSVQATAVQAASVREPCPEKPKKMKASELPYYECPHKTYKDHLEDKAGCRQSKKKILQSILLPHVKEYRQTAQKALCAAKCEATHTYYEVRCDWIKARKQILLYMRDPQNLNLRKGVVGVGAGLGYYIGSGRGIPRRMLWTGVGAATAGMICFPKETDETIREFCYQTGKVLISSFNFWCNKNIEMKDIVCPKDFTTEVKPEAKPSQCPPKK